MRGSTLTALTLATLVATATTGCVGIGGKAGEDASETPAECKDFQVRQGDLMWAHNGDDRGDGKDTRPWYTDKGQVVVDVCPVISYGTFKLSLKDGSGNTVWSQEFRRANDRAEFTLHGSPGGWVVTMEWEGFTGHASVHVYGAA